MSGFSPEWLALREPADFAARSRKVMDACASYFENHPQVRICDLGAGTGASVRAFTPLFADVQWTLVDHDPANLAVAQQRHPGIATKVCDFARDPACWPVDTMLVTATALLDLTSQAWIDRFVAALRAKRLPLLCTLTVDGNLALTPPHPLDAQVFDAFRAHQHGDKGFGAALGGDAAAYFETGLRKIGYDVTADDSPWRIERGELLSQLLEGMAGAVRETGRVSDIDVWRRAVQKHAVLFVVGHRDLFAAPK